MNELVEGEWVRLTDAKGRKHNFPLTRAPSSPPRRARSGTTTSSGAPRASSSSPRWAASTRCSGRCCRSTSSRCRVARRSSTPRTPGQILMWADIAPGLRVVEAGAGSGSLTTLPAAGPRPRRATWAPTRSARTSPRPPAATSSRRWAARRTSWTLTVGDVREVITETEIDRLILDMVDPWSLHPAGGRTARPRRHRLRLRRHHHAAVALRRVVARGRRLHRAARVGDPAARLAPRGTVGPARPPHERPHRVPGHGAPHGAGGAHAGEVASPRPRRLRPGLHRSRPAGRSGCNVTDRHVL